MTAGTTGGPASSTSHHSDRVACYSAPMTTLWCSRLIASGFVLAASGALVAMSGVLVGTQGCTICDCATPGASVEVPPERASDVAQVTLSGATCVATTQCGISGQSPCTEYRINPTQPGTCHVAVTFTSGAPTVTGDIQFQQYGGCCAGLFPGDGGVQFIQVPRGTATDAGGQSG